MPVPESYSVIIVPSDHSGTRQYRVSRKLVVAGATLIALIVLVMLVFAVTYSVVLRRANEVEGLRVENQELRAQVATIQTLSNEIEELTSMRAQVLKMLGNEDAILEDARIRPDESPASRGAATLEDTERLQELFADAAREAFAPRGWPLNGKIRREFFAQAEGDQPAHRGVDIDAQGDAPVLSAGRGRVIETGHDTSTGHYLLVDHGYGYRTHYAGLGRLAVDAGELVDKGSPLGTLPVAGESNGIRGGMNGAPVLYFEIRIDGTPVDPRTYLSPR